MNIDNVPANSNILDGRFVTSKKDPGTPEEV